MDDQGELRVEHFTSFTMAKAMLGDIAPGVFDKFVVSGQALSIMQIDPDGNEDEITRIYH
jgi:hypothetical protein